MRYFLLVFSLFYCSLSYSQEYNKAYVVDLNYLCKTGDAVKLDRFPFYFQHKEFMADVQDEIRTQLLKKFQLDNVYFLNKDSINYYVAGGAIKTEAKGYAKLTPRDSTIYVSVETTLQGYAQIGDEYIYRFITRVNVYNNKGKRIYKFKNIIPFVSVITDNITGNVAMSEEDFYAFYFDGINYAIEGKYDQVTKRYIVQPTAEKYKAFEAVSEKFFLKTKNNGFYYGRSLEEQKKILSYIMDMDYPYDADYMFTQLVTVENLNNGCSIKNYFSGKEYKVRLKGGIASLRNVSDAGTEFTLEIISDGEVIGQMTFNENNDLVGTMGNKEVYFHAEKSYYCHEIYFDDELVALVNPLDQYSIFYLTPDITQQELTDLMNVTLMRYFARGIRRYLYLNIY